MIIDDALTGPRHSIHKPTWERLQRLRSTAKRFIFSDQASDLAGRFAFECGDLVLKNRQFAIPPYNDCYIEMNSRKFLSHAPNKTSTDATSDTRLGYLISGKDLFVFAQGFVNNQKLISGIGLASYQLFQPGVNPLTDEPTIISRGPIDGLPRGSLLQVRATSSSNAVIRLPKVDRDLAWNFLVLALGNSVKDLASEEQRQAILGEFRLQLTYQEMEYGVDSLNELVSSSAGDIRNVWTLLLWLNQPGRVVYSDQPAGHRLIGGKRVNYMASKVVEIELGRTKIIRNAMKFEDRESPVRHQVRGAFHHSGGNLECGHDWPLMPNDDGHWQCKSCGRIRWWVKDHMRGDATKGYNDSKYEVIIPKVGA